ncbi:MAG: PIN domain-containing protein [Methylacidiphilales bacterium]|nr:PIN domain-containing protein [Candidatus Methylacidiphilales bacterium]
MPPVCLVDTSILLRFLTNDHPRHGVAARKLIEDAEAGRVSLKIPFITIAETIFTLQSHYEIDRRDIGRELMKILSAPGITLTCPGWIWQAVESYRTRNVSFGDACLAAEVEQEKIAIASFDRGLEKLPGIERYEPEK